MEGPFGSLYSGVCHLRLHRITLDEVSTETDTYVLRSFKTSIHQMQSLPVQMAYFHIQVTGNIILLQHSIQMRLYIHCPVLHRQGSIHFRLFQSCRQRDAGQVIAAIVKTVNATFRFQISAGRHKVESFTFHLQAGRKRVEGIGRHKLV